MSGGGSESRPTIDDFGLTIDDWEDWITTRDLSATTGLATDRPATGTYTLSGGVDGSMRLTILG